MYSSKRWVFLLPWKNRVVFNLNFFKGGNLKKKAGYRKVNQKKYQVPALKKFLVDTKGQLNSKWIYEVIVSHKMQTKNYKDFCPTKQTRIVALFFGEF